MLTLAVYGLLAVAVIGVLFLLGAYVLPRGEQIAPPIRDGATWQLVGGRSLTPEDVIAVKLPVAVRGYRFAETDLLLDRLTEELRARDEQIAHLRGPAPAHAEPAPVVAEPAPVVAEPGPVVTDWSAYAPPPRTDAAVDPPAATPVDLLKSDDD